ncbi:MAG: hypothetical protein JXX14_17540, partial [Deltaproteobacteria bacterium]|nr:hypothetical protein [Deltaproteobacteria bacterium]
NGDAQKQFEKLVRSAIGPETDGERWPVMVMATRDPGAAGMYYKRTLAENFEWAIIKGYFSDPIQMVGEARFKDNPAVMAEVEAQVTALLSNPYIRYIPGLGALVGKIEYRIEKNTLHFTVPMTQNQAEALFALMAQYSQKLNAKFTGP